MATEYCREVETYLCKKNDGHLVRVVGPSFEIVSGWEADGVPLTVAFRGIDRSFERYYRKGPRRRPLKIDFCDADVRDVFDEWRRAVGLVGAAASEPIAGTPEADPADDRRGPSLPAHLERAVLRLTGARVAGTLGADADAVIDRIAAALDAARASARGLRGEARQALVGRLVQFDRELLDLARQALPADDLAAMERGAAADLLPFRNTMPADAYARAHQAAVDALVRARARLPVLIFS